MAVVAQQLSPGRIVADAFGVRDSAIRALIGEVENGHAPQRATQLALTLGLRNRFQLAHLLGRTKLPSLIQLRAILHVVTWVHRWETDGLSLARQALSEGRDPAAWSKTVRRVTGRSWSEVRDEGAAALARALATRFRGGSET